LRGKPLWDKPKRPRRELSLTLIAGMRCTDGIILAADSEEVILEPPLLKTYREKLRPLQLSPSNWAIVVGGSGEYDFIRMIGDLIEEKVCQFGDADSGKLDNAIRASVAEVWRDHARYEQRPININLLIASRSEGHSIPRLSVVSGSAVRRGTEVEAIGTGDAIFKGLVDRFIDHGLLSTVSATSGAGRTFMVYAMQQAKLSMPGIGGNTRILTMDGTGIKYMKSWSVAAIQKFFTMFDYRIRSGIQAINMFNSIDSDPAERLIKNVSREMLREYRRLKKELQRIENDVTLI
jgi:20S proteasome alpha/beta subunit